MPFAGNPAAVKVVLLPSQIGSTEAVTVIGLPVFTVTVVLAVEVHPLASVPVTV